MSTLLRPIAVIFLLVATAACSSDEAATETSGTPVPVTEVTTAEPTTTQAAPVERAPVDPAALEEVVTTFLGDSPGGVDVLLQRGGEVHRVAVGVGSSEGDPITVGQPFRVGSISKSFVAVMVLQLAEEGSVDLEVTLDTYLPDTTVGGEVTVRQLLSHQSGIPNYTDQPAFFSQVFADLDRSLTPADILAFVEEAPIRPPGGFAYSNTNYILLGRLVEQLDGGDLNASLRSRVTEPLGLTSTFFDTSAETVPTGLVPGWTSGGGAVTPTPEYEAISTSAWSAGSLVSNTDDLAAFLEALSTGVIISDDSFAEMTTLGPGGNGLGIFLVGFSPNQNGFGHGGAVPGYSSVMAIDPDTGDTFVVLTADDALIADRLAALILAEG